MYYFLRIFLNRKQLCYPKHKSKKKFIYSASSSALISGREVNRKLPAFESLDSVKLLYREPLLTFICNLSQSEEDEPWVNEFLKVSL